MKRHLVLIAALLGTGCLIAQTPATPARKPDAKAELAKLESAYQSVSDAVDADSEKWHTALDTWYVAGLDKVFEERSKAGDLDGTLAVRKENERTAAHTQPTPEQVKAMPESIRKLRAIYDPQLKRIDDEVARRRQAAQRQHLTDLETLQKRITMSGDIDQALLVKAEKERFVADLAKNQPAPSVARAPAPPAAPAPTAKVAVEDAIISPLATGAKVWSDRPVTITNVPPRFDGFNFTQHHAHGLFLKFKVLSDGVVYMGCSARWGSTATPEVAKDFDTADSLTAKGWAHKDPADVETTASDMQYVIFERSCKAGEIFSFRTDKYAPPILLVK